MILVSASAATAGDWPQWRYNAGRTAYTPEALPPELHLQWVRELPEPQAAWPPDQFKQQFDASYEPIVVGKLMFVASMVRDSVTAYDTETGQEKWRFYADGPVRFAPAAYKDKIFFVSDDGCLYCLEAASGKLLWKFRGAPLANRVIANWRLSSMYPARGAPVVYDGTVYFAAGIWPFMGTFIYALDAESGKVVWSNSGSGAIYVLQPHASPAFAGVGPQGYMVATRTHLIVPGGRSVPAGYDRKTGAFRWYHAVTKRGHYTVCATDNLYWNDRQIGLVSTGQLQIDAAPAVVTDQAAIAIERGAVVGRAVAAPQMVKNKAQPIPILWQVPIGDELDRLFMVAGKRVYGGKDGSVAAVEIGPGGGVKWRAAITGKPWNALAADGKLFVVTQEGRIYCFSGKSAPPATIMHQAKPAVRDDDWAAKAGAILKAAGVEDAYCVVLGVGTGRLIEQLVRNSKLDLIVLEKDDSKVAEARKRFDEAGWYGRRVHVLPGDLKTVKMPPYLAALVVTEDARSAGLEADDVLRKAFEVLRPYGGSLCVFQDASAGDALAKRVVAMKLPQAEMVAAEGLVRLVRAGALVGSADWPQQYRDMSNSVFSPDKNVKAPLGMLWFGGPTNMDVLPRHGHGPTPQVVAGRLVIQGIGLLSARDVYTGRIIWRRELPKVNTFDMYYNGSYNPDPYDRSYNQGHIPGANWFGSNYVTTPDKVYLANQATCHVLDAATGKTIRELALPDKANWGFVGVSGDLLIATGKPLWVPDEQGTRITDLTGYQALIAKNAQWQYLAGADPSGHWGSPGYSAAGWKTGQAGFGYKYGHLKTVLSDMQNKYTAVYCRKTFQVTDVDAIALLALGVSYDDGVIAYLNGKEVLRLGVKSGSGARANGVGAHGAGEYEYYEISRDGALLRKGENVIALEGHNRAANSSDFALEPCLMAFKKGSQTAEGKPIDKVPGVEANARFSSDSEMLVVMNRHTGEVMWKRPAVYGFRHNAIVAGGGKLFCIDRLGDAKIAYLARRGVKFPQSPTLYALDLQTGREVWKTDKHVFGTWLGYSEEHDVLLQGGSRAGDRGYDEAGAGMVAYKGNTGTVLWERPDAYSGPPIITHDLIITQTGGGDRSAPPAAVFSLLTGRDATRKHPMTGKTIPWNWVRFKGCNTAVASENLLTFRSASAAFVPMDISQGTASIGGFKSGCTSNLIVADGVLNAPDYTRTCTCSYQQQSSLALVHMPELEYWTFDYFPPPRAPEPVQRVGINFGAPGNRTADGGTLWMEFPSVGGPSPDIPVRVAGNNVTYFRAHNTTVEGELNWVSASGVMGATTVKIRPFLQPTKPTKEVMGFWAHMGNIPQWHENAIAGRFDRPRPYTVRLYFNEPENLAAGQRVFNVSMQGRGVLTGFDIASAAGGANKTIVRQFRGVGITDDLVLTFTAGRGQALLSGVELVAE
ncbi:MAG TPA: PQQ-binding-like beta-propeller repeat protein [Phycisphaerae bacterium]|nr:PQQ-binding-like beta-propeller repeat protein [Phycisphaerae bacterium]